MMLSTDWIINFEVPGSYEMFDTTKIFKLHDADHLVNMKILT